MAELSSHLGSLAVVCLPMMPLKATFPVSCYLQLYKNKSLILRLWSFIYSALADFQASWLALGIHALDTQGTVGHRGISVHFKRQKPGSKLD